MDTHYIAFGVSVVHALRRSSFGIIQYSYRCQGLLMRIRKCPTFTKRVFKEELVELKNVFRMVCLNGGSRCPNRTDTVRRSERPNFTSRASVRPTYARAVPCVSCPIYFSSCESMKRDPRCPWNSSG